MKLSPQVNFDRDFDISCPKHGGTILPAGVCPFCRYPEDHDWEEDGALTALDFVRAYIAQTDGLPAKGHYRESVHCRLKPSTGQKDDAQSRCWRCDAEKLLKEAGK